MRGFLLLFAFALQLIAAPVRAAADPAFIKGVALGLFSPDRNYAYDREIEQIKALGANYISLVISIHQDNIYSDGVYLSPATPSNDTISRVAAAAHARGMSVFLFPIIYIVDVRPGRWRGTIEPPSWQRWFDSYGRVMLGYADLAERCGIELLLVGCEQLTSEKQRDLWLDLISRVRQRYRGKLTYSSNWDRLSKEPWLEKLDYLGSNGYFELARSNRPNKQELLYNWQRIKEKYAEWQQRYKKPLLFTEIGYPSVDGCSRSPWDYTTDHPADADEQALCYRAFFESWDKVPFLKGLFLYNWWGEGGANDRDYTPRGKPAEGILREWFARLP